MSGVLVGIGACACTCAAVTALCAVQLWGEHVGRGRRRKAAYGNASMRGKRKGSEGAAGLAGAGLRYAASLTRNLYAGNTIPLSPIVKAGKAPSSRAGIWFKKRSKVAGCSKDVSTAAFCESRFRLAVAGALAGGFLGMVMSTELGVMLGVVGAYVVGGAPRRAVKAACRERTLCAQMHLSEMLEVVALGLRSGLTFDRSFELYGSHFDNVFARSCAKAHRSWSLGLVSREEALRELSASYECDQLTRAVDSIVRSLRFGSPLTELLEDAAAQCRAEYRSALEERVAKAPVKMMLPTGTLILPAMLLLVMGPILLELAEGF